MVMQDSLLLTGSIAENIAFGRPKATPEEIIEAARQAKAPDFILELPDTYETTVGEGGINLSGRQCQRIAIARANLRDPGILILDEATSALDTESQKFVQSALDALAHGRTVITIAHRLRTVKNADPIFVLRKGEIAEVGSYEELAKDKDSLFADMLEAQSL